MEKTAVLTAHPMNLKGTTVYAVECSLCGPLGTVHDGETDRPLRQHLKTHHAVVRS